MFSYLLEFQIIYRDYVVKLVCFIECKCMVVMHILLIFISTPPLAAMLAIQFVSIFYEKSVSNYP